ncbi:MAG: Kiwa anti-phage protein KwaB-like domain-containing protein [Gallionella sp.]
MKRHDAFVNAQKILSKVGQLNPSECDMQLFLASLVESDIPVFQRVQMTQKVAKQFRAILSRHIDTLGTMIEEEELTVYTKAGEWLNEHEFEALDLSEYDDVLKQIATLREPSSIEVFNEDQDFIDELRFYVLVLKCKNADPIYFFRSYSSKKELGRSRMFGIILDKGHFDKFEDAMYLFDEHIDCFASGNLMFIKNKGNFQNIFQFYELLIETAKQTLSIIKKRCTAPRLASGF